MPFPLWFTVAGGLLITIALSRTVLQRLPLTTALFYLGAGLVLSPLAVGLIRYDPTEDAALLLHLTEVAVIISLFTSGLKLRMPLRDGRWRAPLRLATVSMVITVALVAAAGVLGLGLSLGAAVLLGAVLAPTDPVLASDVQVEDSADRDRLRFALTGEAGFNDGTAFPFVMLGLGLLGLEELGHFGLPMGLGWALDELLWSTAAGLGVGWACGWAVGRLVLYLRREHKEAVGTDDFLGLGLIGLAYGLAEHAEGWGFLAVFAAGLALRRVERVATEAAGVSEDAAPLADAVVDAEPEELATQPEKAPGFMAQAVLGFNEQVERIGELTVVLVVGALLPLFAPPPGIWWFVPLLFVVIRPVAVGLGLVGAPLGEVQKGLTAWFGLRGIGSVYYLAYALTHGVEGPLADTLLGLVLWTVAASVVVHGVSVTPLMRRYQARMEAPPGAG